MVARLGLAGIGVFYLMMGGWMAANPAGWYAAVPGVSATGPLKAHFITDIGLAFLASGAGLLAGLRPGAAAGTLALAGAAWPVLHGLFHVWVWFNHGFPTTPARMATEFLGVVGLAALGLWLAVLRSRQEGAQQ